MDDSKLSGEGNPLLDAALDYAKRGLNVFPVYSASGGVCSCGTACGKSAGKHPRTDRGHKDATTDADRIRRWWADWPDANVGVRTGPESGVFVLDVDGPEGEAALADLVATNGPLPTTAEAMTGRGRHLYFRHPAGRRVGNRTKLRGLSLNARGTGGYVVAPPSVHSSGTRYRWSADDGTLSEFAEAPGWVIDLVAREADLAPRGDARRCAA